MNRAMFSGVAGMKAHQTKMDVIGNNIANVNTFGYKSQRAIFSDIYYQNLRNASAGSANRGGTNPSSVGYGSNLAAVQANMTQSSMQNTGFGLDLAIAGDGFLQVMDADGNIFYTKAGLLDYDSNGYLVDINGNFVLGSNDPKGEPGSNKIKLDSVGAVDAKQPSYETSINGVKYTVSASNASTAGNLNLTLTSSESLPAGQKALATIGSNGAIIVALNAFEKFESMSDLNNAINNAVTAANGGKQIDAGVITISSDTNVFGKDATGGGFIGTADAEKGAFGGTLTADGNYSIFGGAMEVTGNAIKNWPAGDPNITYNVTHANGKITVTATIGTETYSGEFDDTVTANTAFTLKNMAAGKEGETISMKVSNTSNGNAIQALAGQNDTTMKVKSPKYFLGGASITSMGSSLTEEGPIAFDIQPSANGGYPLTVTATINGTVYTGEVTTAGGVVTLKNGTSATDTIVMSFPSEANMKTSLGLADNATSAEVIAALQATKGFHSYSATKASAAVSTALTGAQIVEDNKGVDAGKLEFGSATLFGGLMTFMKAGTSFAGTGKMKFDTVYTAATTDTPEFWTVTATDANGKVYSAKIDKETTASSILLKGPGGENDYIQMTNPKLVGITDYVKKTHTNNGDPTPGVSYEPSSNGDIIATPSAPSKNLGLGVGFTMIGGTEGGTVTLDQLTNIAIGADGTVSVTHPEKGTVNVGKISLANFANAGGLQLEGNNYYSATSNSGSPVLADAGTKGTGSIKNSALEMSNVDLSAEFADMITTQRGFQANSRIITVSDTMMEELINLKR